MTYIDLDGIASYLSADMRQNLDKHLDWITSHVSIDKCEKPGRTDIRKNKIPLGLDMGAWDVEVTEVT
eukprot:1195507-Prorocentrum_minimum.AAC.1